MIRTDRWIRARAVTGKMILPAINGQRRTLESGHPAISFGPSSFGYDLRLDPEQGLEAFLPSSDASCHVIDPKAYMSVGARLPLFTGFEGQWWELPGHSYALGCSVEHFNMPGNVLGLCVGKSTYARVQVCVNTTPLEPGWSGKLVIEVANLGPFPVRIYAGEGIAQVLFFESDEFPETSYAARDGKYQNQEGITHARI